MADIEVHIDLEGRTRPVGLARGNKVRGSETVVFEYAPEWLADPDRFSIEPALAFDPRRLRAAGGTRHLRLRRRLGAGHLGAPPHAARRAAAR